MKKKLSSVICTFIAMLIMCTALFSGCEFGGNSDTALSEYTIQYADDSGTHTITVTYGMSYSLDAVPSRMGYDFLGLYDSETGGTQYVSANGLSLAPFTDKKNLVLFPRYKAKEYTVVLDYQGAEVTGSRQLTVSYGSSLPELPQNLTLEHYEFLGWYTQMNCGGTQIADKYGVLPVVSVLNEQNFDLGTSNITLYAGFEIEKHTVTFCFEEGMETEQMQITYNTPISKVVPKTKVNGNTVLTWSKTKGGEVWNGNVTGDMILYAVEYAPVIEFDSNGGSEVTPLVARAGSAIALPTPTKDLAKFVYWEDMNGNRFNATTMPEQSTSLKAVWQAKLQFNENGGSDVDDISVAAGTTVTLPMPERDGYIFAGWYTADKELYNSTIMPSAGVALKAGWFKEASDTVILLSPSQNHFKYMLSSPSTSTYCYEIDVQNYINNETPIHITIDWCLKIKANSGFNGSVTEYADIYSKKIVASEYLLWRDTVGDNIANTYKNINFTTSLTVSDNFFIMFYCNYNNSGSYADQKKWLYFNDFYYTIHYPDTTNLYL